MDKSNDTINELEALKAQLLDRVQQIDQTIGTLRALSSLGLNGNSVSEGKSNAGGQNKYAQYDRSASTKAKMAFILRKENRFLHIREIANIMHDLEPKIEAKEFISKLYPAVAELKKAGSIVKVSVGQSNVNSFWGSKNWLDEKGKIIPEYLYDESQVTKFGVNEIDI